MKRLIRLLLLILLAQYIHGYSCNDNIADSDEPCASRQVTSLQACVKNDKEEGNPCKLVIKCEGAYADSDEECNVLVVQEAYSAGKTVSNTVGCVYDSKNQVCHERHFCNSAVLLRNMINKLVIVKFSLFPMKINLLIYALKIQMETINLRA